MPDADLRINWKRTGDNGTVEASAEMAGAVLAVRKVDIVDPGDRDRFAAEVCQGRAGIDIDALRERLKDIAAEQLGVPAAPRQKPSRNYKTPSGDAPAGVLQMSMRLERMRIALRPYRPFPVHWLPSPFSDLILNGAEALGCESAYIALPTLASAGAAIGNTRRVLLKRGWVEPPVIWASSVGDSGTMKSPALDLGLRPTRRHQERLFNAYGQALAKYKDEHKVWKALPKAEKAAVPEPEPPLACERVLCGDTTVEALADRLQASPRGVLVATDELPGWINSFNQYKGKGMGSDVAHWLSMHRAGNLLVDRKLGEKKVIYVRHASVAVVGGIQPGALRKALTPEFFDNGLAARLLLANPPRRPKQWSEREIDAHVEDEIAKAFGVLFTLKGGTDVDGNPEPTCVPLSDSAKSLWIDFVNRTGQEQVERGDERLVAAFSKLEGYAARIALIVHQMRHAADEHSVDPWRMDRQSIEAGIELSRWFGYEAERIYAALAESEEDRERRVLITLIQKLGGRITCRQLMQHRSGLKTADDAKAALQDLAEQGWGTWSHPTPTPKGGRPSEFFTLTTRIYVCETPTGDAPEGVLSIGGLESEAEEPFAPADYEEKEREGMQMPGM